MTLDKDIQALVARDAAVALSGLTADVWSGVESRRQQSMAKRLLASSQALIVVCAVLASAGVGASLAFAQSAPVNPLSPGESLAPSNLLFGDR